MDTIERKIKDEHGVTARRQYVVYTQEEAQKMGIEARHWSKGPFRPGDWVLSDDGYVAAVVRVNGPYKWRGQDKYEIVLPYAKTWSTGTRRKLLYEEYRGKGVYCWHAPRRWAEQETKSRRFQDAVRAYCHLMIKNGGFLTDAQMMEVGQIYRPHDNHPDWAIKRVLKTYEGKAMVKKELTRLMEEHGVTAGHVIRQHQMIVERAIQENQLAVAEKANARFIEMLDLMPTKASGGLSLTENITFGHLEAHAEEEEADFEVEHVPAHSAQ